MSRALFVPSPAPARLRRSTAASARPEGILARAVLVRAMAVRRMVIPQLAVLAWAVAASDPARAQDHFGAAVAAGEGQVAVLKPGAGRGAPALYLYGPGADRWTLAGRLGAGAAAETGESYAASVALDGGRLWIGSGDAGVRWAAHAYRRAGGSWVADGRVALAPAGASPSRPTALDLAGLMRILQPPARVVALDGTRGLAAVVGDSGGGVRVLEAGADGAAWSVGASLEAPGIGPGDRFGASLALEGDRALVGAPLRAGHGAVFVFERDRGSGGWSLAATLAPADTAVGTSFGTAVALDGGRVFVGAPGAGSVTVYREDAGGWAATARIAAAGGGEAFGTALAVRGDELWVGAPGGSGGRGSVHRFRAGGGGEEWSPDPRGPVVGPAPPAGPEAGPSGTGGRGAGFGSSLDLGDGVAVVGAPFADGGLGRAAVFVRGEDGAWSDPAWIRPGGDLAAVTGGEVRCADGRAAGFECENVDLLAFLPLEALGAAPGERVSDVWGWTDPETGREYALVGRTAGAALVDVTDPARPVYRGLVRAPPSGARDLKVYRDHLFFTGDGAGDHGMVIFDLTRLRRLTSPADLEPDTVYRGIASAHNLVLDTDAGFAYPVGASGGRESCGGGLHMVDVREPLRPVFAGCYTDTEGLIWQGRTHDAQCVVYRGPDDAYRGRQICFASNETALRIVDVTDKADPVPLAAATYPRLSYVHQGWLTEDHRYFFMDDELDELTGQTERTRTLVWDVVELDDPVFVGEFPGSTGASDHNLYIRGNRMYQANYHAGMQVWDVSDPENPVEIGHFDTTPWEGDPPGFFGAWTAWPFFESGAVAVTSMHEGLFILRPRVVFP